MDISEARRRYGGCYVTVPTPFSDEDLAVDFASLRSHVDFLIDGGVVTGNGLLLAGGAAGDFSTMTFDERVEVATAVVQEARGRVSVAMGAQTTSTMELIRLAKAAEAAGVDLIQVSPPFYFAHTNDDFYEYVLAAARSADVGLIIYNTFWTSQNLSHALLDRLAGIDNVVALKWSAPDNGNMEFEQTITRYADRFMIIDNQMRFVVSHMLGASAIELHICNHWPAGASGSGIYLKLASTSPRSASLSQSPCRLCSCGRRWRPGPAVTDTSTSCAWNLSGVAQAGAGRRPRTSVSNSGRRLWTCYAGRAACPSRRISRRRTKYQGGRRLPVPPTAVST